MSKKKYQEKTLIEEDFFRNLVIKEYRKWDDMFYGYKYGYKLADYATLYHGVESEFNNQLDVGTINSLRNMESLQKEDYISGIVYDIQNDYQLDC